MIGILLLSHNDIGHGLIEAVRHILGQEPTRLELLSVDYKEAPDEIMSSLQSCIDRINDSDGVLILSDIYGASHTNAACKLLKKDQVELIAGLNLPMLIRALNYRHLPLSKLVNKAMAGGCEGIYHPPDHLPSDEKK